MRNILYIVQGAGGGVSRYLVDIISNLDQSKFRVGVIFNSKFEDERFSVWRHSANNISFYDVDTLVREVSPKMDVKSIQIIMQIITEFKPDVVHAQSSKAGLVGRVAAKLKGVKRIVYTPHAYAFLSPEFSSKKRAVYALAERWLSRFFTDMTINCSRSEYEHALDKHIDKPKKLITISNAVPPIENIDVSAERQRLNANSDDIIVGNLARVSTQKNPKLFEAIATAAKRINPKIRFIWIGSNLEHRTYPDVEYMGEMENTQELIAGMNVYLSTSLFEGLSYALLEAAAVGVRVVATNVPGNDEFIAGYNRAEGVELTDNPEIVARKIIDLAQQSKSEQLSPSATGFNQMIQSTLKVYQ